MNELDKINEIYLEILKEECESGQVNESISNFGNKLASAALIRLCIV